jgi:hypothetical protein
MRFNVPAILAAAAVANAAVIPQIPKVDGVVGGTTSGVTSTVNVSTSFHILDSLN